jgi:putative radical SAM enzyme (TIGR03279 family)
MLGIAKIIQNTIASDLGIRAGDRVMMVNNNAVHDTLDFRYYAAEEKIELLIQRENEQILFEIEKDFNEDIGIEFEAMKMKACGNNCVFCFVYQNPKGMRRALYFKDEDFRFSFLYGHYVTLTTVKQIELERIVEQKLSPLYISVHATEEKTRKQLLGIKRDDHLLEKISFLVKGGIELHAQIVLCPGINDGVIFDQTVNDLKSFYPGVRSIAVVPVGLTRHRDKLYNLRLHSIGELRQMINYTDDFRCRLRSELGSSFIYLSDEFFIKARKPLPDTDYYDDFFQIENGVGEFRDMIDKFEQESFQLPEKIESPCRITWVTGTLAAGNLNKYILSKLRKIQNLEIDCIPVKNNFYGHSIGVSGLLVGEDIYEQLKDQELGKYVFLPPRILNHNGLLLDNWSIDRLEKALQTKVYVYNDPLAKIGEILKKLGASA